MLRRKMLFATTLLGGIVAGTLPAQAGQSSWTTVTVGKTDATFHIDFGHMPDLVNLGVHGKPLDSFQILVADGLNSNPIQNPRTVLRGDEIRFGGSLPIRHAGPPDLSDPHSGGWGSIAGTAPFSVHGDELTLTAPLAELGVPSGRFSYDIATLADGRTQNEVQSHSVPVPSAAIAGLLMLVMGFALRPWRRFVLGR